jgi:uncharacterized protein (UPF0210 family)
MNRADAIVLLRKLDELAAKSGFAPNIGTAMVGDGDDTAPLDLLAEEDGVHWRAIREAARLVKNVAVAIAGKSGWTYAGIDPTPAPLGDVSIGRAIESFTGGPFGVSGTMTAAAIITRAVQAAPVLEDNVLARRWAEGTYNIDSLLAYSAVCAGGLDTVPLPGDVSEEQIARILGDVATLAYKWQKPLAARLLPVPGRKAGDRTEFDDPRMANTTIQALR